MILSSITTVMADHINVIGPFILLAGLATALIGYVVYALVTGSVVAPSSHRGLGQNRYMRDARPGDYWFQVVTYALLAAGLLCGAYALYQGDINPLFVNK